MIQAKKTLYYHINAFIVVYIHTLTWLYTQYLNDVSFAGFDNIGINSVASLSQDADVMLIGAAKVGMPSVFYYFLNLSCFTCWKFNDHRLTI